ncbi:hypothetical protein [Streptomyces anulatus]|uniref:hypothetical protein n=1 Tax=Streptomyces anulatus TaxID=1892 RepID=UPI003422C6B8
MRCSTLKGMVPDCTGTATHMLLYPDPETQAAVREPVCQPCGQGFARRPRLKGRIVPLHVHMPRNALRVIEGHRLIEDAEHEARCFDCGLKGSPNWFRFQTNGCSGRPESITVLHYSREFLDSGRDMVAESARLWWDYAVDYLHMQVEDWRLVDGHAEFSAYFTFRDREYGVKYNLLDRRFGAVKLSNRGFPEPALHDVDDVEPYNQAVFYFHNRTTDSGSMYFATWTPGHPDPAARELVILYHPEGQISQILRMPAPEAMGDTAQIDTTHAICDVFGPISDIKFQTRIYE